MKTTLFLTALLSFCIGFSQDYNFEKQWSYLGPDKKPLEDKRQSATGIGPVEHIAVNERVQGHMLASSINGGLFYTTDGGEQWINAGSDDWAYSSSSWAAYYPLKENVWFANSALNNPNGSPGSLSYKGGIMRTKDAGISWELIGDYTSFTGSPYIQIFGIYFDPDDAKTMYVNTAEGLYFTRDCLADKVKWNRVQELKGWVYDVVFIGQDIYCTQMQHGKWSLYSLSKKNHDQVKRMEISDLWVDDKESITIEKRGNKLLILLNFTRKGDELHEYSPVSGKTEQVLKSQRVVFGKGMTFSVNPHNQDEMMVGYATTVKRWDIPTKSENRIKTGFHVDIEYIAYDPFDTSTVYLASHGGVYKSVDNCESWISYSKGLGIAECEGLAVAQEDPNQMAIGCFHDGSSVRADWDANGIYEWKNVNGGDGLVPLMPANKMNIVFTSNQYMGGGMFYSADTGRTRINLHSMNNTRTSGWLMSGVLAGENHETIYMNFEVPGGSGKGNIDVGRTNQPTERRSLKRVTNFKVSHEIEKYSIYCIYHTEAHPNTLIAHMIEHTKDEKGKNKNVHRLWRTDELDLADSLLIHSWYEIDIPRSDWIASITIDEKKSDRIYLVYASGKQGTQNTDEYPGLVYHLRYKKQRQSPKREIDLSRNLSFGFTGRYNIVSDGKGGYFIGTRQGVFYGDKKTLKGRRDWVRIGYGTPHCKVHGIHFHKEKQILTVAYYGRGVWRYQF